MKKELSFKIKARNPRAKRFDLHHFVSNIF